MTSHQLQPQGWTESWPGRLSGGLAITQGLAIIGVIWFLVDQVEFQANTSLGPLPLYLFDIVFFSLTLGLPAILGTLSGIGMLFHRRGAWLLAVLAQGLLLASSLNFYFYLPDSQFERSFYIYAIMAVSGFMAFYLNTADVRLAFSSDNGELSHSEEPPQGLDLSA